MSTTMKKTSLYRIDIMGKSHGLASVTDQQRVTLFGLIVGLETSLLGPKISQTTSEEKIVCTHLVWNTAMNGMMWSVAIVTSILVRKVSYKLFSSVYWDNKGNNQNKNLLIQICLIIKWTCFIIFFCNKIIISETSTKQFIFLVQNGPNCLKSEYQRNVL